MQNRKKWKSKKNPNIHTSVTSTASTKTETQKDLKKDIPWWCLILPFVFLYEEGLLRWQTGMHLEESICWSICSSLSIGFVITFVLSYLKKALRNWMLDLVVLLTGICFSVAVIVKLSFQVFMTPASILSGGGDVAGGFADSVQRAIVGNIGYLILAFLPLLFCVLNHVLAYIELNDISHRYVLILVVIGGLILQWVPIHGNSRLKEQATVDFNYTTAVGSFGLLNATVLHQLNCWFPSSGYTTDSSVIVDSDVKRNQLDFDFEGILQETTKSEVRNAITYIEGQSGSNQNEYTGVFAGKNLVFITAEAFSSGLIDPEITPTLYKLANEGIKFEDYYQPWWGGSTTTGEYSILTGMIPTDGVNSMKDTIGHDLFPTIGNMLQEEGYFSRAYHDNDYTYYDRNLTHENFGYEKFIGMGNGMEEGVTFYWPCSDEEMMEWSLPQYLDESPFSIYYMTVSGHSNYDLYYDAMAVRNIDYLRETYPSFSKHSERIQCYIAGNYEVEKAVTLLVEELKKKNLLQDTVICLTADHYPYGLQKSATWDNDINYLDELYGTTVDVEDNVTRDSNTLIIYNPELTGVTVADPTSSVDILPTLANLFGLSFDSRLYAGRDVFSDTQPLVVWSDRSWKTEKGYYDASTDSFTPMVGETIPEDYVTEIQKVVRAKFSLSEAILKNDLYRIMAAKRN